MLTALSLLALGTAAFAHDCRMPFLNPPAQGPMYGHHYFDFRRTPLPQIDERALSELGSAAACADHTHLVDASGECLTNEKLRELLAAARRSRLERALADLDAHQEPYRSRRIAGQRPAWTQAEAQAVLDILRVQGDVLPEDVVTRYEGWLAADGWSLASRVRTPDSDPFGKRGYFSENLDAVFSETGAAFTAPRARDYRAQDAVIDSAVWSDPKAGLSSGYDATVRRALKLIVRYADPQDAADALDIVSRLGPRIKADPDGMFPGQGGAMSPVQDPKTGETYFKIRYNPGFIIADGVALRSGPGTYREYLGANPNLAPYRGEAPLRTEKRGGMTAEVYSDSVLMKFSDVELAQTILHELLHIRTRERGQGAVVPISEEASRLPELRFVDNYARATGAVPQNFLSKEGSRAYLSWKYDRTGYRRRLRALMSDPLAYHVAANENTPEGLAAKLRGQLALQGRAFTADKQAELAKYVDAEVGMIKDELERLRDAGAIDDAGLRRAQAELQRDRAKSIADGPSDAEWREFLQDKLARTPEDRKLVQQLTIDDLLWRQRYQFSLPVP